MGMREKLIELLWTYDQMRMMRMSIEECVDKLMLNGLSISKTKIETKCADFEFACGKIAGTRDRLAELSEDCFGVDPAYFGTDAYAIADHLIANGVTIQQWIPVTERLPKPNADGSVNCVLVTNGRVIHMAYITERIFAFCENGQIEEPMFYEVTHWMPLPEPPKGVE